MHLSLSFIDNFLELSKNDLIGSVFSSSPCFSYLCFFSGGIVGRKVDATEERERRLNCFDIMAW